MKTPKELRSLTATIYNCRSIGNTDNAVEILEQFQEEVERSGYERGLREASEISRKRYDDPAWQSFYFTAGVTISQAILAKPKEQP